MIRKANLSDKAALCGLFSATLLSRKSYISHGEIQMGIALDETTLAPDFIDKWGVYIENHITDPFSKVLVYEADGSLLGFILGTKEEDGDKYFGVINDVCVDLSARNLGLGAKLMDAIFEWFDSENLESIFLESGVGNHDAHSFFEKRGFKVVSKVFMLRR